MPVSNNRTRSPERPVYFLAIIICLLFPSISVAENNHNAFKIINTSLQIVINSNHNSYHRHWEAGRGLEIQVETPFYYGIIESGLQIMKNTGRELKYPEFISAYTFLGWGVETNLTYRLKLYSGFRFGNYYMSFDDNQIDLTLKSESELGCGITARLGYAIRDNLSVGLSGRYRVIYTNRRIYHSFVSFGISRSFITPCWLKGFLD